MPRQPLGLQWSHANSRPERPTEGRHDPPEPRAVQRPLRPTPPQESEIAADLLVQGVGGACNGKSSPI
eukprot:3962040-Lingulodinium_polyedra.AAC.1